MYRVRPPVLAIAVIALSVTGAGLARAQDPQPAPAAAPAVDSNTIYVGDWSFSAGTRDSAIAGFWRIVYTNGRFSGVIQRTGQPPAPISSITVRDHYRNITITAFFNGESYTFSGHLDNPQTINGMLTTRGMSRFRAVKQ